MEAEVQFGKALDLTGTWHSLSHTDDGHSSLFPTVPKPVTAIHAAPEASRASHHGSHKYLIPANVCLLVRLPRNKADQRLCPMN